MACCGDTPTLEILAAVSILREHLPELKIRVINVVDLMKLQPIRNIRTVSRNGITIRFSLKINTLSLDFMGTHGWSIG